MDNFKKKKNTTMPGKNTNNFDQLSLTKRPN